MTRDEHTNIINQIRSNPSDIATVSTLLAQLSDDYNTTLADVDAKTKNVETLTAENTKLLKSNNDLFQLVGSNMNVFKQSDNHQTTNQEEDKKPTFDALFDDKGNLK